MPWYPHMRRELVNAALVLADRSYQQQVWIDRKMPDDVDDDSLDYIVHFLFDDTSLSEATDECIGYYVLNEQEADAIKVVIEKLEHLFAARGLTLGDADYLATPEWDSVVAAAMELRRIFIVNEELDPTTPPRSRWSLQSIPSDKQATPSQATPS